MKKFSFTAINHDTGQEMKVRRITWDLNGNIIRIEGIWTNIDSEKDIEISFWENDAFELTKIER